LSENVKLFYISFIFTFHKHRSVDVLVCYIENENRWVGEGKERYG